MVFFIYYHLFHLFIYYHLFQTRSTSCPRHKRRQLVDVVWQPKLTATNECAGLRAAQIKISVIWCHSWYDVTGVRWLCKLDRPHLYIEDSTEQQRKNNSSLRTKFCNSEWKQPFDRQWRRCWVYVINFHILRE